MWNFNDVYEIFFKPGEVTEVRILGLSGKGPWEGYAKGTVSGYFNDPEKFSEAITKIEQLQYATGIYFTINPVDPALLARANNRLIVPKTTTTDNQIIFQRWLLIDTDPIRPAGISATDGEVEAAIELSYKIADHLTENGFPEPITANSGNGGHLIYLLPDLPNTIETSELKSKALRSLAQSFNTHQISIDEKVFNAARIVKLYGTWARKGDSTSDRPHRISGLVNIPHPLTPVSLEQLSWLAAQESQIEEKPVPKPTGDSRDQMDVEAYLKHYGIEIARIKKESTRTIYGLQHCVFNPEHIGNEAAIIQMPGGKLLYQCFHNTCQGRTWMDARKLISGDDKLIQFYDDSPGYIQSHQSKTRNLTDEIREWVLSSSGQFQTRDIRNDLGIFRREDQKLLSIALRRIATGDDRLIEKDGDKNGCFRRIEKDEDEMEFIEDEIYEYPIKLPFKLNDACALYPQNIIIIAGSKSAGKTALLLEIIRLNQDNKKIVYLNSEMGKQEWSMRLKKTLGVKRKAEIKFKALRCHNNFHDKINGSDKIYIVDFMEIHENFYEIAKYIRKIHEKLRDGICFIAVQKKGVEKLGRGAEFSMEKARLYLTLDYLHDERCTKMIIMDAKAAKIPGGVRNFYKRIKILDGVIHSTIDEQWQHDMSDNVDKSRHYRQK